MCEIDLNACSVEDIPAQKHQYRQHYEIMPILSVHTMESGLSIQRARSLSTDNVNGK